MEAAAKKGAYSDGIYFIALAGIPSPDFLVATVARALNFQFYQQVSPKDQVLSYLREKNALLILDNFEHLIEERDLITQILHVAPRITILTTSRERLNLQEEWLLEVEGMTFPRPNLAAQKSAASLVEGFPAIQLFIQRAQQIQPRLSVDENIDAIVDICRRVEGMPLAIEFAASWLRVLSCRQIADQIAKNSGSLSTSLHNSAERHRSIHAVFEHSWWLLSEPERNVLMKLSVFRGGRL